jgi:hypothetical protein
MVGLLVSVLLTTPAHAQALRTLSSDSTPAAANSICGDPVPPSISTFLPPAGSGPVVYLIAPCFERQGGRSRLNPQTYLQDIHLKPSRPSNGEWTPFDAAAEQVIFQDFQRLSTNHTLADLTIKIRDYTFPNGVVGKLVTYDMLERN